MQRFKAECKNYLLSLGIGDLRSYGRHVGVERPTTKNKEDLIQAIIGVLAGEIPPVPCSKLGAPVLNTYVNPKIMETIDELRLLYASKGVFSFTPDENGNYNYPKEDLFAKRLKEENATGNPILELRDSAYKGPSSKRSKIHVGQLETLNSMSLLLPLDCSEPEEKIVVPVEVIREYGLREGDVVECYAENEKNCHVATMVLSVNGMDARSIKRTRIYDSEVCEPSERIRFYVSASNGAVTSKYLQWILPIGKGQRGLIVSAPKTGKTCILQEIAKSAREANKGLEVIVLLVEQSPETVAAYRKVVAKENLLYTTYDHDPDRQVFVAEYALKRAKAYAESGKDVLFLVDSFNALARAYNDTDFSSGGKMLSCGLENKTVQYLKKFFGMARCLADGGSVTIVGAVATDTGNPADAYIATELTALGNWKLCLDEALVYRRIYPAFDFLKAYVHGNINLLSEEEQKIIAFLGNQYVTKFGAEKVLQLLDSSITYEEFVIKLLEK